MNQELDYKMKSTDKIAREYRVQFEWHLPSDIKYVREVLNPDPRDEELEKLRDELKEAREVIKSIAGDLKCEEFIDVDFWENCEDTASVLVNDTKIAREYLARRAAK